MEAGLIIDVFRDALKIVIMMVASIVLPGLCVGLMVSVFQAATQINEQTLSFVPRLIITMLALVFFAPWLLELLRGFSVELIENILVYVVYGRLKLLYTLPIKLNFHSFFCRCKLSLLL